MYQAGLGLFPSQRRLAKAAGVSRAWVQKTLQIAQLPAEVVAAFTDPRLIQPQHAEGLNAAIEVDRDAVLARAASLRNSTSDARGPDAYSAST